MEFKLIAIILMALMPALLCNNLDYVQKNQSSASNEKLVLCYFMASDENLPKETKLTLNMADTNLCNTIAYYDPERMVYDDEVLPSFYDEKVEKVVTKRIRKHKADNPNALFLLDMEYDINATLINMIKKKGYDFDEYADKLAERYSSFGYDGAVFAFYYPGLKNNVIKSFSKACSHAFKKRNLLLIAYSQLTDLNLVGSYNYYDYVMINTMFFGWETDTKLRLVNPLFPRSSDIEADLFKNAEWIYKYYQSQGLPLKKILLGVGLQGKTYKIYPDSHKLGSPVKGIGFESEYSKKCGVINYYETCRTIREDGWRNFYNKVQQGVYSYNEDKWIAFENVRSMKNKADFVNNNKLGGAWLYAVNQDDFSGKFCGEGKYPLTTSFMNQLNKY